MSEVTRPDLISQWWVGHEQVTIVTRSYEGSIKGIATIGATDATRGAPGLTARNKKLQY